MGDPFRQSHHHRSFSSRIHRQLKFGTGTHQRGSSTVDHFHVFDVEAGDRLGEGDPYLERAGHVPWRRGLEFDRQSGPGDRAGEEGCHLSPGDRGLGTVPDRVGGATRCDSGRGQGIDAGPVGAALGVGKPERGGRLETERSGEEGCHLCPSHGLVRAVTKGGGVTTGRDSQHGEAFHIGRPPLINVHIGETVSRRIGIPTVENPYQPHRHHPTHQRISRTELPRSAQRALQHTHPSQTLDTRPMRTRLIEIRQPALGSSRTGCNHHQCNQDHPGSKPRTHDSRDHPHTSRNSNPGLAATQPTEPTPTLRKRPLERVNLRTPYSPPATWSPRSLDVPLDRRGHRLCLAPGHRLSCTRLRRGGYRKHYQSPPTGCLYVGFRPSGTAPSLHERAAALGEWLSGVRVTPRSPLPSCGNCPARRLARPKS